MGQSPGTARFGTPFFPFLRPEGRLLRCGVRITVTRVGGRPTCVYWDGQATGRAALLTPRPRPRRRHPPSRGSWT